MAMKVKIFYERCDLETNGMKDTNAQMFSGFETEQTMYIEDLYNQYVQGSD